VIAAFGGLLPYGAYNRSIAVAYHGSDSTQSAASLQQNRVPSVHGSEIGPEQVLGASFVKKTIA
jgi:hypothetical protein